MTKYKMRMAFGILFFFLLSVFGMNIFEISNISAQELKKKSPKLLKTKTEKDNKKEIVENNHESNSEPIIEKEDEKPTAKNKKKNIYVIPVSGDVEPGLAAFIQRSVTSVSEDSDALIVLKLDTFGGRVDSALKIVESLLTIPKEQSIAFVASKAISAGALIALSCGELVMKHNTTIGDCAPIIYSNEGPKVVGEKFQSPLRAKFRSLAKRNGYPETLAEAMVTGELVVYQVEIDGKIQYMDSHEYEELTKEEKDKITSKKTIVKEGELLTMDDVEANQLSFSKMSVADIDEMLLKKGITNYEIKEITETWSETLVRFISTITPILLMIGLAAIYTELQAPGFGAPGIVGLICLALVFLNQYLVGLANYTELLIILMGLLLLGVELLVLPGFGIAGIAGIGCIIVGMILTLQDFVIPDPSLPWQGELLVRNIAQVIGSFVAAFILSLLFLRYVFPRFSTVIEGPYLATTLENSHADSSETKAVKVGDTGIAYTFLRPSGKAKIEGEVFDVIAQAEFIEKGTPLEVLEIKGNRIIVAKRENN